MVERPALFEKLSLGYTFEVQGKNLKTDENIYRLRAGRTSHILQAIC